jgi:hypothetical protein
MQSTGEIDKVGLTHSDTILHDRHGATPIITLQLQKLRKTISENIF